MNGLLLVSIVLAVANSANAQLIIGPATFKPANPTEMDTIQSTYILRSGGCVTTSSTTVIGTVVRTTVRVGGCFIGPPVFDNPAISGFGPLRAGTYIYEIYDGGEPQFVSSQPLVVAAAVPTISHRLLIALVLALGCVATLALKH